ncbi:4-(cytidine 5'-diphospho)-2-C-methyl-D-erythritol kinase [Panacibacter ginsenosidivorans]|uniref:4-diphosphocytidyl-2-C-methyl-D-erythritol kinase n=1 Tax=Panacibacter ginsenosidivorans TaxID=1813871 RepID=A0A5B8V6G1_9BACT|nr:4-(cytidine 5'-diphospho)-2-C-methyl-D-erythritol kinase [Panacibacter ginsenosidivorans]QEC67067.1 4-(cytidine 5'-diphospho)-2-C-methyl-D-erythritol kinase [Panacibacter ginsenosidivorans]
MVNFPNCKINLGLNIIGKRADGYHDLETVFYPVNLNDALEIIPVEKSTAKDQIEFSSSGLNIDGVEEDNLCIQAYRLLKKNFPELPAIKMHLHKTIPMGAGLGGGSADAAFTLTLLNNKFNLGLSTNQLISYALQLGSDCPFFIINKPCFATGRGEVLEEINLDLSKYKLAIVNPGIHINTGRAFSQIKPAIAAYSVKEIIKKPVEQWKDKLVNDFEELVVTTYAQMKDLKETLYNSGAIYASMSGSGSTFYGIFDKEKKVDTSVFPADYFIEIIE